MEGQERYDAVIIGAGLAGLTCGTTLAKGGKKVKILEQHAVPGGCISYFERKGFTFDVGLHLTGECSEGGSLYNVLAGLGLLKDLDFHRMDPIYKCSFPGESWIFPSGIDKNIEILAERFPDEEEGIKKLFSTMKTLREDAAKLPSISATLGKYLDKTFQQLLDDHIKDSKLKAILGVHCSMIGTPSSKVSAVVMAGFMNLIFSQGGFFPKGGTKALVNALEKGLKGYGGRVEYRTKVKEIFLDGDKAVGIATEDGREIMTDFVVSACDVRQTFFQLIGEEKMKTISPEFCNNLKGLEVGISSFLIYLGVDMDLRKAGIDTQEVVLLDSMDFNEDYESILKGEVGRCILISMPTISETSIAPPGKHIVIFLAYAPYRLKGIDWKRDKEGIADRLIKKVEARLIPGLSRYIEVKEVATPLTLERFTLNSYGAVVGWAMSPASFAKPQPKTPVKNLYLTGHWTVPGGGTNGVIPSGWMVGNMILEERM